MKRSFAVVFGGIFTFLISLTILFAGMDLELKPTRENKTPVGSFDDSFIRSNSAPSIIRTLTVTPQLKPKERIDNKTINHSTDLASIWGPDKSLSISGFQNVDSVGYFSVSIFGTVIVDTGSQNGKKPSPTPEGWEFAGTGNYNIKYCTFNSPPVSSLGGSAITKFEIIEDICYTVPAKGSADSSVRGLIDVIKEVSDIYGYRAVTQYPGTKTGLVTSYEKDSASSFGVCSICNNTSYREILFEIGLKLPNSNSFILYKCLPAWNGYNNACQFVKSMWDAYRAKRNWHESQHINSYIAMIGSIKTKKGEIKYCECTASSSNILFLITNFKNSLSEQLQEEFNSKIQEYEANEKKFDEGNGKDPDPYIPFTDPTHSIVSPCSCP